MAFWGCCSTSSARTHKDPFAQEDELRLTDSKSTWGSLYIMIWAVKEKIKSFTNIRHRNNYLSPLTASRYFMGWCWHLQDWEGTESTWGHQLKAHRHFQEWNSAGIEQIPRHALWAKVVTLSNQLSHSRQTRGWLQRLGWHIFSLSMNAFYVFSSTLKAGMRKKTYQDCFKKIKNQTCYFIFISAVEDIVT